MERSKAPCAPCARARLARLEQLRQEALAELDAANVQLVIAIGVQEGLPGAGVPPRVMTHQLHDGSHI